MSGGLTVIIFFKSWPQCQCLEHIKHIHIRNNNNCYYLTDGRGFAYDSSSTKLSNALNSINLSYFERKITSQEDDTEEGQVWSLLVILPPKQ